MCVAYPARILEIDDDVALVAARGRRQRVRLLALDEPVAVDDWLLVQSGLALARIDPDEAVARVHTLDRVQGGWS